MLLNFNHDDIAEKLQLYFGEFLSFIERSKNEIWPKSANNEILDAVRTLSLPIAINSIKGYTKSSILYIYI